MGKSRFDLDGQVALVTGASRGIGQALAVGLAEAGADVVVSARTREALTEVHQSVISAGRRCWSFAMDVSDLASIEAAFEAMDADSVSPSLLINNAGIEEVRPSVDVSADLWDRIVDTNLKGAFFVAQAVARRAIDAGRPASIVNLCSVTSEVGVPTATPYTSSKSGLLGMTRALAAEWATAGVRVNGLGPGYFRTELTDVFYQDDTWRADMLGKIPMQRFGVLDDLIGACVFLCSPAASYITGQVIYVDGGYLASI